VFTNFGKKTKILPPEPLNFIVSWSNNKLLQEECQHHRIYIKKQKKHIRMFYQLRHLHHISENDEHATKLEIYVIGKRKGGEEAKSYSQHLKHLNNEE